MNDARDIGPDTPLLPRWLWLWLPPVMALIIFPVKILSPAAYAQWIDGEQGLVELATPIPAFLAFCFGFYFLRSAFPKIPLARVWVLMVALGGFYFAGEELSWGQQLAHWNTPEAIDKLNDQHETNLHNMSSWFDQKPRLLLELWAFFGGVVVPLMRLSGRRIGLDPNKVWFWFWPTVECLPTAILAFLIRFPERYKHLAHIKVLPVEIRWSEPQEYYFALLMLIFVLAARQRAKALAAANQR
jgi:hypothetical protein